MSATCPATGDDDDEDDEDGDSTLLLLLHHALPQHPDVNHALPQQLDVNHAMPQLYDVNHALSQPHDVNHATPQLHDVKKHALPKLHDVNHAMPKLHDVNHAMHHHQHLPSLDDCPPQPPPTNVLHADGGALLGHHAALACLLVLLALTVLWVASVGVHGPTDKTDVVPSPDDLLAVLASVGVADAVGHSHSGLSCLQCALLASLASVGESVGCLPGLTALKTARLPALLVPRTSVGGDRTVAESGACTSPAKLPWCQGATEMLPWLCLHARCHPGWRGLPRDAAKRIPLLEDSEDLAMYISWTEEMLKMILLLEDAEDKLRGPQGEGEGDIEYDDYHYCCRCSQFTKLTHEG